LNGPTIDIGTLLHGLKQGVPLPALKDDLEALLSNFPDDLTIVDELISLKRKPSNQWAVVLFAALDQMLVQAPPTSTHEDKRGRCGLSAGQTGR
jgi:hypothetical protein